MCADHVIVERDPFLIGVLDVPRRAEKISAGGFLSFFFVLLKGRIRDAGHQTPGILRDSEDGKARKVRAH